MNIDTAVQLDSSIQPIFGLLAGALLRNLSLNKSAVRYEKLSGRIHESQQVLPDFLIKSLSKS